MIIRNLKESDAPLMLEWMHDESVVEYLAADFASKTIDDCIRFINNSLSDKENLNLAVADSDDSYMGTVSLKHIDMSEKTAEFAITMRKLAMGTGAAAFGMEEIIKYGMNNLGIKAVYWCVSKQNQRAIRFYNKRYKTTDYVPTNILANYTEDQAADFLWYAVRSEE